MSRLNQGCHISVGPWVGSVVTDEKVKAFSVIKRGSMHPSDISDPNSCLVDFIRGQPVHMGVNLNPNTKRQIQPKFRLKLSPTALSEVSKASPLNDKTVFLAVAIPRPQWGSL